MTTREKKQKKPIREHTWVDAHTVEGEFSKVILH